MARRRRQTAANQPNLREVQGMGQSAQIPAESIEITHQVAQSINDKVKGLISGLTGLKKFYLEREQNEDFNQFYDQNQEGIEDLLKVDLNKTYRDLVANSNRRNGLHQEMVRQNVISQEELNLFLGVVSTQPYANYVRGLNQGKTAPNILAEDDINNLLSATTDNISLITERLKAEGKITEQEAARLLQQGPKTAQQIAEAKDQIYTKIQAYDLANRTSFFPQYRQTVIKEHELSEQVDGYIDEYNVLVEGLVKQIQEMYNQDTLEQMRKDRLKILALETGLPVKPGQVLWGLDLTIDPTNLDLERPKNNRIEIKNITFGDTELDQDPDILPEFKANIPTLEPVIEFTALSQDGQNQEITYKMSASNFRKWLIANQVSEKFNDTTGLEQAIGLPGGIKVGQIFEYVDPAAPEEVANDNGNLLTVKIEKIENGFIYLDKPVILDMNIPGSGLGRPRRINKMDFGEFAKWYRSRSVVPEIESMERLDELLAAHHQQLVEEMGWPAGHGEPISLSNAEFPLYLIGAYNPEQVSEVITGIQDGKILTEDGGEIRPQDFLRYVRAEGLTRPTAEQLEELKKAAAAKRDQIQLDKLKTIEEKGKPAASAAKIEPLIEKRPGYFSRLWTNTTFLNLMDMYELFINAPITRVQEWMKDKGERRQYKVGKEFYKGFPQFGGLSDLSDSFEDKMNSKIAGDVKGAEEFFEKNYDAKKVLEILHSLKEKTDKTLLKACLQFLSKKGELNWEADDQLWQAINYNLHGPTYPNQFGKWEGRPVRAGDQEVLKDPLVSIFDQCRLLIDKEYGDGTFDSLNSANEQVYQKTKEDAAKNMHKWEFLQGGIGRQLQKMLFDFEQGKDVNAAEFDGLLTGAISGMEVNMEQGMLLFVSAWGVRNPQGKSLLTFSRLNPYIKNLSDHLVYVFYAVGHNQVDEEGNPITEVNDKGEIVPKRGKFTPALFRKIYNDVISKDIEAQKGQGKTNFEKFTAGKNTINWIQETILTHNKVKERSSNKAGNPNTDVGLYHYLGPLMYQENDIDKVIGKTYGSMQKPTILKNMYAGYNNQLILRARRVNSAKNAEDNELRAKEFAQMVSSFTYFNNVLRNRIRRGQPYMRMNDIMFSDIPDVEDKKLNRRTIDFCNEVEEYIRELTKGVIRLSGSRQLNNLAQATILSRSENYDDDSETHFREELYKTILELAKTRPAELANLSAGLSTLMKGMSGAQISKEEMERLKQAA